MDTGPGDRPGRDPRDLVLQSREAEAKALAPHAVVRTWEWLQELAKSYWIASEMLRGVVTYVRGTRVVPVRAIQGCYDVERFLQLSEPVLRKYSSFEYSRAIRMVPVPPSCAEVGQS
jgi:hypothetical protein